MYNKNEQQTMLALLQKINDKLDKLTEQNQTKQAHQDSAEIAEEITPEAPSPAQQPSDKQADNTVWNLTQIQYELSNELFSGVERLTQLIKDGERYTTAAKGKYQK